MKLVARESYRNEHEGRFADHAREQGWEVTKRGWPDFLCRLPDGRIVAVEVKPPGRGLKRTQREVFKILSAAGIPCFVSDGETLKRFEPTTKEVE